MQQEEVNIDAYVPNENDSEARVEGNRVRFGKLQQEQWERLERKNFSQFETRVLTALQNLGQEVAEALLKKEAETNAEVPQGKEEDTNAKKKKDNKKAKPQQQLQPQPEEAEKKKTQQLEICVGDQLYTQYIRPKLMDFGIIPKLEEAPKDEQKKDQKKKPEKKGGKNAVKKEDLMRIELSKDKVLDQTQKLFIMMGIIKINDDIKLKETEFLKTEQASKRIKSLKWLELKFAALIIYADQLIKCHIHSKFRDEYAFELIYFLKNVYLNYQNYQGQSYLDESKLEPLSQAALEDLRKKLRELYKNFGFSNRVLFNKYPKLVIDTDLNQSFFRTDIKPYKSQVELIKQLSDSIISKPSCIFLSTMVGTGKTVLSVGIAQFLQKLKNESHQLYAQYGNKLLYDKFDQLQFLYCCPLDTVRTQVGSAAYERQLKFAIASMWCDPYSAKKDTNLGYRECPRLVNSWQNKHEPFPTLVIADFKTTLELLKEREVESEEEKTVIRWQGKDRKAVADNPSKSGKNYILFIDEPTVDADFPDAETTKLLIEIIRRAPPITILSSATLPPPEKLPNFLKLFMKNQKRDQECLTPVIHDSQFQIGCQVFSHDGHKFLPHYLAKNKNDLSQILQRLELNPFMKRCYNANAYCELFDRMKTCGISDIEDFEQFDIITQEFVQRKSIELLHKLLEVDEETFRKVCNEKPIQEQVANDPKQATQEEQPQEEQLPQGDEEEEYEYEYVYEYEDGTQVEGEYVEDQQKPKKPKYIYQIQIDDEDKMKFTAPYNKLNMKTLGGKMAHKFQGGCLITVNDPLTFIRKNFEKLIRKCSSASEYIKNYQKQLEYLDKEIQKKEREIDDEDERTREIQNLQESMKLSIAFPDNLKINTLQHFKTFVTNDPVLLESYRPRKAFSLEGINFQIDVPDDVLLYLFAGIAAYTEKPSKLPVQYYEEVQKLATNGQLALIISDDSMCYGVNYPLNHVIVTDEMAEQRSIGALFQLIGRAGRVGVSWTANAYLGNRTFNRLISYLNGQRAENEQRDEAFNMEKQSKEMIQYLVELTKKKKQQQMAAQKVIDEI